MDVTETSAVHPTCPKCSGAGKRVGTHEDVIYFRCLVCARIWAEQNR